MKVVQIQSKEQNSGGVYSKGQSGVKKNQSQMTFGKDSVSKQVQSPTPTPTVTELRATQTNLKEQISVMLQTETDPKKIKKLKNYQNVLDVLLENGKNTAIKTIKKTPTVAFGNAAQKAEAQKAVHIFSGLSAGIAAGMAQMPGVDEIALAANDALMAVAVCNAYGLALKATVAKALIATIMGNTMGTAIFAKIISKGFTWIPAAGNALNAGVAGTVTEIIGHNLIGMCEKGEIQKAIKKIIEKEGK